MSYEQANKSKYGDKKIHTNWNLNSSRTINKSQIYEDNGDFSKIESKRVNPRKYHHSKMIFDDVISHSVDTDRKITGWARKAFKSHSQVKLHYKDKELLTVQKLWQQKKKNYGVLRKFMLKGNVEDYYHKEYDRDIRTKFKKIRGDFWSSSGNIPGNKLGKRKNFHREVPKVIRK